MLRDKQKMKLHSVVKILLLLFVLFAALFLFFPRGSSGEGQQQAVTAIALRILLVYGILGCAVILAGTWIRRHWKEALLIVIAVGATLVSLECAFRFLFPYATMLAVKSFPSKTFHHIFPPDTTMYQQLLNGEIIYFRLNSDGLRTKYSREAFQKYMDRIVVLGDSFMLGPGIKQEVTCPEALERELRARCGRNSIAVLNAGIWSYSPFLEELLFKEKLVHYKPTLVLLFLDATDIGDDIIYAHEAKRDTGGQVYFDVPEEHPRQYGALWQLLEPYMQWTSPLVELVQYPWNVAASRLSGGSGRSSEKKSYDYYHFQVVIDDVVETNRFFIYRYPLEKTKLYFLKTLQNISSIAAQVKSAGGDFKLILLPRYHHWSNRECPENWELKGYKVNEPFQYEYFRFFEEARGQLDYEVINLLPDFQATDKFPLVFSFDPHLNEQGLTFAAQCVADKLIAERALR